MTSPSKSLIELHRKTHQAPWRARIKRTTSQKLGGPVTFEEGTLEQYLVKGVWSELDMVGTDATLISVLRNAAPEIARALEILDMRSPSDERDPGRAVLIKLQDTIQRSLDRTVVDDD
tara:strand:- start:36788 stop:37141 length:354 start_codon:yes stop_codon:yes gene_type:complete